MDEPDGVVPSCSRGPKKPKSLQRKPRFDLLYGDVDDHPTPDVTFSIWACGNNEEFEERWRQLQSGANLSPYETISTLSSDVNRPTVDLLTFEKLLSIIGFLGLNEQQYREMFQSFPLVKNDDGKCLTIEENNLRNIYKCDAFQFGCYFTTDCPETFEEHLAKKHPKKLSHCLYCKTYFVDAEHRLMHPNDRVWEPSFAPWDLPEHIKEKHSLNLKYQCNLCFYRAFSPDHIFIHQAYQHRDSFLQTIGKLDQNPMEDGSVVNKTCKIIVCSSPNDIMENLAENFYLEQFGSKPEAFEENTNCIYCDVRCNNDNLFNHFVTEHPDKPILSKSCERVSESSQHPEPAVIIKAFVNKLKILDMGRAYDDRIMKAAFQAYNDQARDDVDDKEEEADSSQQKGTKRKQSDDDGDGNGNGDGDGDGEDHSANQDEMDSTSTDPPASKRRPLNGLFGGYVSVPTWNQTKAAVGMATTAIVALGFYKLAHYLPMTIKKLTE